MGGNGYADAYRFSLDRPWKRRSTASAAEDSEWYLLKEGEWVNRGNGENAVIAHLVPIKRAAHDIFAGAFSVLVVTPLAAPQSPSEDLLNGLFDLTPAEARVARSIVDGKTVESLASNLGLSRETVRTQLKSVLAKTGTDRPSELIHLLVGKKLPFHTFE